MNRTPVFLVVLLATLIVTLPAAVAKAAQEAHHRLVYDAESALLLHKAPGERPRIALSTEVLKAGTPLKLSVINARCSEEYHWRVNGIDLPDVEPGFRGLKDAGGLVAELGLPPAAKGEAIVSRGPAAERSVADWYSQLLTVEGVEQARLGLEGDITLLAAGLEDVQRDIDRYQSFASGLAGEITETSRLLDALDWSAAQSCLDLSARQTDIERIHRKFAALRQAVMSHELASFPARYALLAGNQTAALREVAQRRRTLEAALEAARLHASGSGTQEAFLGKLKRLQAEYGDVVGVGVLKEIAQEHARRQRLSDAVEASWKALVESLRVAVSDISAIRANIESDREAVDRQANKLRGAARLGNQKLERAYGTLAMRRDTTPAEEDPGPFEGSTGNRISVIELERRDRYAPMTFDGSAAVVLPAGAAPPAGTETQNRAFEPVTSVTYEFHRLWRFAVGAGPLVTGLGDDEFGVRQVQRLDDQGLPLFDEMGNDVLDPVVARIGGDSNDVDYALFVTYYFSPFDAAAGADDARPLGLALGFSLDKPRDNLFLGLSYQPTLGVQLVVGGHYGRTTVLQDGVMQGDVLAPGALDAPTRLDWELEPFLSFVLEAKVFKRLFTPAG